MHQRLPFKSILDKILDEIVIASDAMTMIAEIIADSLIVIGPPVGPFIFETRSKQTMPARFK